MAFFKDLGKKIGEVAQDAQNKTSELIEVTKLNSAIKDEKEAISALQQKIGLTIYARYAAGDLVPDPVVPDVEAIVARMKAIMGLEAKIVEIKRDDVKSAVTEVPQEPIVQSEKVEPAEQPEPDEPAFQAAPPAVKKFCTNCGSLMTPGATFCGQCGQNNG